MPKVLISDAIDERAEKILKSNNRKIETVEIKKNNWISLSFYC